MRFRIAGLLVLRKDPVEKPRTGLRAPLILHLNVGWKAPSSLCLRLHHLPSGRDAVMSSPQGWHRPHCCPHRCSHRPLPSAWLVSASTWQRSEDSRQESLTRDTQPKGTENAWPGHCTNTHQHGKVGAAKHGGGKLGLSTDWNKSRGPRARALQRARLLSTATSS